MSLKTKVILDGLFFPEGPRWHNGKLWFSDMQGLQVMTVDATGQAEKIVEVSGSPSGLGWLPDGRLQVVSMLDRRLLRLDDNGLVEVADLNNLASFHCNDMVIDRQGRAYIGNFGFDYAANAPVEPAEIVLVTPEGHARDGSLNNRRIWAELEGVFPDGICLDAEGAIWVAAPHPGEVMRVLKGGNISDRVTVSTRPYACMLGGDDRCTLFICTAGSAIPDEVRAMPGGKIETIDVEVPGTGLP